MKSVRLDPELEAKLARAAQATEMSQSQFIRDAVARRCEDVLGASLAERLAGVVGIIESSGGRAEQTGSAFRRILATKGRR